MIRVQYTDEVYITHFDEQLGPDFARLNRRWLEELSLYELQDEKDLSDPRASIIDAGGDILFATLNREVVGTCAIVPVEPASVELKKLAVAPGHQGRGVGRRLTIEAIMCARKMGAEKVTLFSNSNLASAVRLYESLGFQHKPVPSDINYRTADVYMELVLAHSKITTKDVR